MRTRAGVECMRQDAGHLPLFPAQRLPPPLPPLTTVLRLSQGVHCLRRCYGKARAHGNPATAVLSSIPSALR